MSTLRKWWKKFKRITKPNLQVTVLVLSALLMVSFIGNVFQQHRQQRVEKKLKEAYGFIWSSDTEDYRQVETSEDTFNDRAFQTDAHLTVFATLMVDGLPKWHKVVKGECLWRIAQRYFDDPARWPEIWELNRELISNPDLIYPGQIIQIY